MGWFHFLNTLLLALAAALLIAYVIVSFSTYPPYDYHLLMRGTESFCFDNANFSFGISVEHVQRNFYPAPFYTTFCLPNHYTPQLLLAVWMLVPFGLAVWLADRRAAVLVYPPLFILLLLGQSSWLTMLLFIMAARHTKERPVRWWHGLIFGVSVFKPHIAFPAFVYLVYRWRNHRRTLVVGALTMLAVVLPSFVIRPGWISEWLPSGRGFEPVNLASIAYIPVRLGRIPFAPDSTVQALVWLFCLAVGIVVYILLKRQRSKLEIYDWMLLFFFVNPALNDYDLVVLLPFIANHPRRLLLAVTAGIVTWVYAMMTLQWNMSFMVMLVLLFARVWHVDGHMAE